MVPVNLGDSRITGSDVLADLILESATKKVKRCQIWLLTVIQIKVEPNETADMLLHRVWKYFPQAEKGSMDDFVLGIAGKAEYIAGPHLVYDFEYDTPLQLESTNYSVVTYNERISVV